MRLKLLFSLLTLNFFIGAIPAMAQTRMDGAQLDALMTGNTVYLEEPNGAGEIVLWYGADGIAMARLPSGSMLDGTWSIKGNSSCIVWSYSPKDSCSKVMRSDGNMTLNEAESDRLLGTVLKIVPGNVEKL